MTETDDLAADVLVYMERVGVSTITELSTVYSVHPSRIRSALDALTQKNVLVNIKRSNFSMFFYMGYLKSLVGEYDVAPLAPLVPEKPKMGRPRNDAPREVLSIDNTKPFVSINHDIGWNRVAALRRIRDRLISEYHPILNLVIQDYVNMLSLPEE